jgi:hypothetical protein
VYARCAYNSIWRDEFLEAGQARLFELTVQDVKQRNRDYSQDAILEAIDEALANG